MSSQDFKGMGDFYPYYLGEHHRPITRVFHVVGTLGFLALVVQAIVTGTWWLTLMGIVVAYGFAWFSHFIFEKNRPATFKHPFFSLVSDFRLTFEVLTGRQKIRSDE
jgi:hypothetical protein